MKANELRYGNLIVTTLGELHKVCFETFQQMEGHDDLFKPIPLTKEWLLKFGFHLEFNNDTLYDTYYLGDSDDSFYVDTYDGVWHIGATTYGFLNETKHVHTLQNLYFSLAEIELIIK